MYTSNPREQTRSSSTAASSAINYHFSTGGLTSRKMRENLPRNCAWPTIDLLTAHSASAQPPIVCLIYIQMRKKVSKKYLDGSTEPRGFTLMADHFGTARFAERGWTRSTTILAAWHLGFLG
jgi:hypothetical protein